MPDGRVETHSYDIKSFEFSDINRFLISKNAKVYNKKINDMTIEDCGDVKAEDNEIEIELDDVISSKEKKNGYTSYIGSFKIKNDNF